MMRAAIFDGDAEDAEALRVAVLRALDGGSTAEVAESPQGLRQLLDERVDVLFVDLSSSYGEHDGVQLARAFAARGTGVQIVFTGTDVAQLERAYQTEHVWFLLKPVDEAQLAMALEKARGRLEAWRAAPLVVRVKSGDRVIDPQMICYVESDRRILHIHLSSGDVVETYCKLSELKSVLPKTFVQSHKSYLANLNHVLELRRSELLLDTNQRIPVSQARKNAVRDAFHCHYGRRA